MSPARRGTAVVKVGGGLLTSPEALDRTGLALASAGTRYPLVVVPGGGPFADTVRRFDASHGLSPVAAHWMAILGQDQYAHALAERIPGATLVSDPETIAAAQRAGRIPVLAPFRWMLAADVLPHDWDATGDSVAAFVAGALDADVLVLVKPVPGTVEELSDRYFGATLPAGLPVIVLGVAEIDRLAGELESRAG